MFVADSNQWVYYLDQDAPEHGAVVDRLERLLDEEELLQPAIVQIEVVHWAFRRWGPHAVAPVAMFLGLPAKGVALGAGEVGHAADLLAKEARGGIGARDAAVLGAAQRHGASLLCTGDKALARAGKRLGLQTRNLAAR